MENLKKNCGRVVKTALHVSRPTFRTEKFPWIFLWNPILLRTSISKKLASWQKKFGRIVKTDFYLSRGSFLRKRFFLNKWKICKLVWTLSENFPAWKQNIFGRYWKGHSTCPDVHFLRTNTFWKKIIFGEPFFAKVKFQEHFQTLAERFFVWYWKIFGGVVETAFYLSRVSFLGKICFFKQPTSF